MAYNEDIPDNPLPFNESFNATMNTTDSIETDEYCVNCIIVPILVISCLISMLVNVVVIASANWIRCPMTPNLKISLSLAAADACSSSMYGLIIFTETYILPDPGVIITIIEMIRLTGIVITVVHLLALSINHYIGILKPLHYNAIVTSKKVCAVLWLLWIFPTITLMSICAAFDRDGELRDNFISNTGNVPSFMTKFNFRMTFSSLFFVPVFIMVVCYTHILIVVKKQQNRWNNLSRIGSTRNKGKPSQKISRERKQLEGNVRAIYTTMLILGSCVIGWTPALLNYILACAEDCYVSGEELIHLNREHEKLILVMRLIDNLLVIMKMLANPIIYSIRMKEIKDGTKRMMLAISGLFCRSDRNHLNSSGYYYQSRLQNSSGTSTLQVQMSLKSSRNGNHVTLNREAENSFL